MRSLGATLSCFLVLLAAATARADETGWPREFDSPAGSFVIYQPQPEELTGDVLTGRAAFSLRKSADQSPAFGVLWYSEEIQVDRDSSTVTARSLDVTKVRLPGITQEDADRYETLVENQSTSWDLSGSLEDLQSGLAAAAQERESVAGLDNAPPKILFHNRRAILVVYDGRPALEPIEGTQLQRVSNTPYAVVFDARGKSYYLNGANLWYQARNPLGPWAAIQNPPDMVRDAVPPDTSSYDQVAGPPPEVLTATEPTELIATDGAPRFAPLVGDALLYIANTESDVVFEVETQSYYVLISGRWFRSQSTDGPWTFVRGDRLPESFKRVPLDSPKGNILASVAGTDQAEDAVADAEIPQTSAIQRGDQSFAASYDGDPDFEPIEGTDLEYAVNTDAEVILADGRYYACDQGVWYIADDPDGPWSVSDTRPVGIEDIPPSCPVYDVRYVYVYDSTPEVVYVGYLPGYLGCYPYYGTVVYGTGYRYHSWRGRHHYWPHRFTWGFHARYNPWLSRWSFGFSYSSGFLRVGTRWRSTVAGATTRPRSLWFGPGGYRRPMLGQDLTLLRTPRPRTRTRLLEGVPANMYNRQENITRVDKTRIRTIVAPIPKPVAPNDVFAGQDGKVYRRDPKGWQVRTGNTWTKTRLPSPPVTAPVVTPARERPSPVTDRPTPRPRPRIQNEDEPTPQQPPVIARPEPRPERRPESRPERPAPQREQPMPQRERPQREPERQTPRERPAPPPEKPTPGDLEREYRARNRADKEDSKSKDQDSQQQDEPKKEKPQREQRSREETRPGRSR